MGSRPFPAKFYPARYSCSCIVAQYALKASIYPQQDVRVWRSALSQPPRLPQRTSEYVSVRCSAASRISSKRVRPALVYTLLLHDLPNTLDRFTYAVLVRFHECRTYLYPAGMGCIFAAGVHLGQKPLKSDLSLQTNDSRIGPYHARIREISKAFGHNLGIGGGYMGMGTDKRGCPAICKKCHRTFFRRCLRMKINKN